MLPESEPDGEMPLGDGSVDVSRPEDGGRETRLIGRIREMDGFRSPADGFGVPRKTWT